MDNAIHNEALNDILINTGKSLLQYVGEAWPWTSVSALQEQRAIDELVSQQQRHVAAITELLGKRAWTIDFGTYPTEYTDLHYAALDFLLAQLIASESALVDDVERAKQKCSSDTEAVSSLDGLLIEQREITVQLRQLSVSATGDASS